MRPIVDTERCFLHSEKQVMSFLLRGENVKSVVVRKSNSSRSRQSLTEQVKKQTRQGHPCVNTSASPLSPSLTENISLLRP